MMPITEAAATLDGPLCCSGITRRFDATLVLQNITLNVPRGAIYGLVGRNGAGKTTLIQILLGLLSPDSGSASVLGEPALGLSDRTKVRLGYVSQQPEALGWMSVGDMLEFMAGLYPSWDRHYVSQSLERWNIVPSRPLSRLSTGERQRVALIRALAIRPELLVLDEPAAALDPVARRDLLRELATRAGESGTTVLFSTHIVSDLERVASHIACLHRQRLLIDVAMDDFKETHARLMLSAAVAARIPEKLPGELSRRRQGDGALSVVLARHAGADWPAVTREAGAALEIVDLEDLFIELTA